MYSSLLVVEQLLSSEFWRRITCCHRNNWVIKVAGSKGQPASPSGCDTITRPATGLLTRNVFTHSTLVVAPAGLIIAVLCEMKWGNEKKTFKWPQISEMNQTKMEIVWRNEHSNDNPLQSAFLLRGRVREIAQAIADIFANLTATEWML